MFAAGIRLNLSNNDADYPAMVLANYMLGGGFLNSRLATRIRGRDGLSHGISGLTAASKENGSFPRERHRRATEVDKVEVALKRRIGKGVERSGFTADEITAAKSEWSDPKREQVRHGARPTCIRPRL